MRQISRTTNPTDLRRIDKKHFVVRSQFGSDGDRTFWVEQFDYLAARVSSSACFACIAHAGSTEEYFPLGTAADFYHGPFDIRRLATNRPLKFRFILHEKDVPLLVAYADGIRAVDESGQLGHSLVDIEPTDLGGIAWKLSLPDCIQDSGAKPNVLVERRLFPTARAAVRSTWFSALVMPEVMRQIATEIAKYPEALDDTEAWPSSWWRFLEDLGIDRPSGDIKDSPEAQTSWVDSIIDRFAAKNVVRRVMEAVIAEMEGAGP